MQLRHKLQVFFCDFTRKRKQIITIQFINSGRKIKKESRVNVPVVAAYEMLAKKLAFHTCSEVTFNPTFFFYFSVSWLQQKWKLNSRRERRGEDGRYQGILASYVGIHVSYKILRQYINDSLYNHNIRRNITKNRKIFPQH